MGQWVRLKNVAGLPRTTPQAFQVIGFMPPQHVANQYRIRSDDERYERVVEEGDLENIPRPGSGGEAA